MTSRYTSRRCNTLWSQGKRCGQVHFAGADYRRLPAMFQRMYPFSATEGSGESVWEIKRHLWLGQ